MCNHGNTKKIDGIRVCLNCGLTVMPDGTVFFDKKIVNRPRRRRAAKK